MKYLQDKHGCRHLNNVLGIGGIFVTAWNGSWYEGFDLNDVSIRCKVDSLMARPLFKNLHRNQCASLNHILYWRVRKTSLK